MRRRGAGGDRLALRRVRLAARARAAAGRPRDVRRRRGGRGLALSRLAARGRAGRRSGSRRRRWSIWTVASRPSSKAACRPGRSRTVARRSPSPWLRAHGVREIVVDSSGNAGASFAAYAARAGMRLRLFVPADASPAKLLQARAHGAEVVPVPGPRSAAGEAARAALEGAGPDVAYGSHMWQPAFLAGTATFAYEVFEQLGRRAPDVVVAPLGGGTLLLGVHLGFDRLRAAGLIDRVPRLVGVQSAACAPLARAFLARTNRRDRRHAGTDHRRGHPHRPPAAFPPDPGRDPRDGRRDRRGDRRRDPGVAADAAVARHLRRADLGRGARRPRAIRGRGASSGTVILAMTGHGLKSTGPIGEILAT